MDIKKLADVKDRFADYEKIFNSGDYDKAADILSAILERIEECTDERKAGTMDDTFVKKSDMDGRPIYISLNHVMEYYVYACYFEPETDVLCTELPVGEYYRTYGSLCLKLSKFRRAEDAFKKAICWNPVDLDSYLGLAECYKNLNMLSRYLDVTKQAYRFCCSRATMARYSEIWDFILLQGIILRRQECATHIAIYIIRQTMQIMSLNILSRH